MPPKRKYTPRRSAIKQDEPSEVHAANTDAGPGPSSSTMKRKRGTAAAPDSEEDDISFLGKKEEIDDADSVPLNTNKRPRLARGKTRAVQAWISDEQGVSTVEQVMEDIKREEPTGSGAETASSADSPRNNNDTPVRTIDTPATAKSEVGSGTPKNADLDFLDDDIPLARLSTRRRTRVSRTVRLVSDSEEDEADASEADSDFVPAARPTRTNARRAAPGSVNQESVSDEDEDEDEDDNLEDEDEDIDDDDDDADELLDNEAPAARRRRAPRVNPNRGLSQYQKTMRKLLVHHEELADVWPRLEAQGVVEPQKAVQPKILTLKLLPFQLEGLHWLRKQEQSEYKGGILADEMGMGKTIQTVAMLCSDVSRTPGKDEGGTLIVAPTVAIMQWKNEINLYTNNALKILIYHGQNREISAAEMKKYDIVLTTYNLIESVWRKQQSGFKRAVGLVKETSLLHSIEFHRIVLDEAHNIKDRSTNTARAVFNLKSELRWCLSGTPLQNRVGELFSLLRFLEVEPFSNYFCMKCPCKSLHWKFSDRRSCDECGHKPMDHTCWFNHELLKPIVRFGATGEGLDAFRKIHLLLKRIMLRRTKVERADDMGLPPRVVNVRRDLFNAEEEDMYDSLYTDSKRKFDTYADNGTVLNNYANIFQLITRMRQMADHPDLILKRMGAETAGSSNLVCKICDDLSEDAIKSRCHHTFCRACIQDYIEGYVGGSPPCPTCRVALDIDLTAPALEAQAEEVQKRANIINRIDMSRWRTSTKIEALVEELYKLRRKDSSIKSIVFSQWTSFLELVHWRLRRAGFQSCKLDGSMTPEARAKTIDHFSTDPNVSVFLVSLKAGGVALNLTEASQVFILDPWWNPSAEWQAADRVHRLGQRRPVRITRLIVENSIESRIVELQEKKAQMIQATVSSDEAAMNRLTPEDMSFLFN